MSDFKITSINKNSEITRSKNNKRVSFVSIEQKPDEVCLSTSKKPQKTGQLLSKMFLDKIEKVLQVKITEEELQDAQTKFQQIFMRNDITLKDTKKIIIEYQKAEKIKDKKEYAKAIYNLAKKNYGFDGIDLPIRIIKGESIENNKKIGGGISRLMTHVDVDIDTDKLTLLGIIHHELRHAKQYYYSACLDKEVYAQNAISAGIREMETKRLIPKGEIDTTSPNKEVVKNTIENITARWGELAPEKIPEQQKVWASIMLDTLKDYVDASSNINAYNEHLHEKDAKLAENMIKNLIEKLRYKTV